MQNEPKGTRGKMTSFSSQGSDSFNDDVKCIFRPAFPAYLRCEVLCLVKCQCALPWVPFSFECTDAAFPWKMVRFREAQAVLLMPPFSWGPARGTCEATLKPRVLPLALLRIPRCGWVEQALSCRDLSGSPGGLDGSCSPRPSWATVTAVTTASSLLLQPCGP